MNKGHITYQIRKDIFNLTILNYFLIECFLMNNYLDLTK